MTVRMLHPEAETYARNVSDMTARARQRTRHRLDIPYGPDERHVLDIYMPDQPVSAAPVLCFLHGGAWRAGDKSWMGFLAPLLVDVPAIFVAISYRLAPAHPFPSALDDTLHALDWIRGNIAEYGGDRAKIAIGGHSAGGHLATLAALADESETMPITACFPVSATFDLREISPEDRAYTAIYTEFLQDPERAEAASPFARLDRASVPFLITYGDRDFERTREQGRAAYDLLLSRGKEARHLVLENAGHFDANARCNTPDHPWIVAVRRFLATGRLV